jgi:hypothetical protein
MRLATAAERRRGKRYPLQFDLEYRVFGKGHSIFVGSAKTVNISSGGVLLTPTDQVCKGQLVELSIKWPIGVAGAPGAILEVLGRAQRVDASGTAVRILRFGFYPRAAGAGRDAVREAAATA